MLVIFYQVIAPEFIKNHQLNSSYHRAMSSLPREKKESSFISQLAVLDQVQFLG